MPTIKYKGIEKDVPKQYIPQGLTSTDKKKQIKSIVEQKPRPKVESVKSKRSTHVERFEKKYGYKITNVSRIDKEIITKTGINKILDKGKGAYFSSGSRPNQTPSSWAYARLASVIMGGPARKVDRDIWEKYKR